ncbi:IPT/TIG domain-containing protein [Actinoplanes sp. NPDC051859]|uniref:IPT/TIG domain-containing protein n=1 Tax=Actinoplanes sp. NPDC051859 TaxID=3363909 RepID=UPI0037B5DC51
MRLMSRARYRGWLMVAAAALTAAPVTLTATPASAAPSTGKLPHAVGGLITSATRTPARVPGGVQAFDVVPDSVDLRQYAPAVGDQGQISSCVAWTIGYSIMGYYANRTNGSGAPYAPLFLYQRNVVRGGAPNAGLNPDSVLANVQSAGIDTQADYFQGTTDWKTPPTQAQIDNAKQYRVSNYQLLFNGANQGTAAQNSIKQALATGAPVALGIPVYKDFMNLGAHSLYSTTTGGNLGNHMIAAYGYDAQGVIIRNSWGTRWGNNGDAKLSWAFITKQAMTGYAVKGTTTPATPVTPSPAVAGLSVTKGTAGTQVTITGSNLADVTAVRFGNTAATFQPQTAAGITKLVATTPTLAAAGLVDVTVTSPAGSSTAKTKFTYSPPPPAVTALTPDRGVFYGGTVVTLTGTSLIGVTGVKVGTAAAPFKQVSPTSLTFTAPAVKAAGPATVTVTTKSGVSTTTGQYTYVNPPAPTVTELTPATGPTYKTTPVVVTGTGFTGATSVTVDGSAVKFSVVSATQLKLTLPVHAAGTVTLRVTTAGGPSTVDGTFTYVAPPAPVITALSAVTGSTKTATAVTITGTGFTNATAVLVGSTKLTFIRVSDTQLKVSVPGRAASTVAVTVTTPGGTSAGTPFTFVAPAPVVKKK